MHCAGGPHGHWGRPALAALPCPVRHRIVATRTAGSRPTVRGGCEGAAWAPRLPETTPTPASHSPQPPWQAASTTADARPSFVFAAAVSSTCARVPAAQLLLSSGPSLLTTQPVLVPAFLLNERACSFPSLLTHSTLTASPAPALPCRMETLARAALIQAPVHEHLLWRLPARRQPQVDPPREPHPACLVVSTSPT